jgi:hypothetical protein
MLVLLILLRVKCIICSLTFVYVSPRFMNFESVVLGP